ncbi:hypothetical protein CEXT_305951 [Caerostris extrusa]|nr:hypothetical protein CEXT_305951 [Caerostris extrusa]
MKETTDKSEDPLKRSTSVDELSSLPEVKIVDPIKPRQMSEESSDSPKLGDSHSKLSFLQDSPTRTHDTLSRLSLLQDSPPNYGMTLLEDTPPSHRATKSEQDGTRRVIQENPLSTSRNPRTLNNPSRNKNRLTLIKISTS